LLLVIAWEAEPVSTETAALAEMIGRINTLLLGDGGGGSYWIHLSRLHQKKLSSRNRKSNSPTH
jgi:hypothetical protein